MIECHRSCLVVSVVQSFTHRHIACRVISSYLVSSRLVSTRLTRKRFANSVAVKLLVAKEIVGVLQIHALAAACRSNMWTMVLLRTGQQSVSPRMHSTVGKEDLHQA